MMIDTACPFCQPRSDRVFLHLGNVLALWDSFPVTPGHALIVPVRHIASWDQASNEERAALWSAIDPVCAAIRSMGPVDAFNFGINSGAAAGQTVPHLHLHVIPRRHGDVPDPRGGVRHVIPERANYLIAATPSAEVQEAGVPILTPPAPAVGSAAFLRQTQQPPAPAEPLGTPRPFLTTGETVPLLPELERDLASAIRVDIAVAFIMPSGIARLRPHFEDLLRRRGYLRVLTGDYLGLTDPDALQQLLDLRLLHPPEQLALRVFVSGGRSFHPKAYLLTRGPDDGVAYVGSSNLSLSALTEGVEWNYRIASGREATGLQHVTAAFESLFAHPSTQPLDEDWIAAYRARRPTLLRPATGLPAADTVPEPAPSIPKPNPIQQEALSALAATRAAGNRAGLVVMATGLGKTWLAAFDIARPEFQRVLFVAHREEILSQALSTFRRIRPDARLGMYQGSERAPNADILFASIQTLSRPEHLGRFGRAGFDYIIIDEFHHAAAASYRRLIRHFDPQFLLGLTATPERTDGGDLLALCGENLVYRCGVPRGIELGLLCAYAYFGVPDDVDYRNIPWRSTRFDEVALTEAVATTRRANNVLEQWRKRHPQRTLAFCVSQRHADFMRDHFAANGIACASVHSGVGSDGRALSLERLAAGEIQIVFAVDMFNEGVDVPAIDAVMMLRPTESPIIWLQQFGRGLRKYGDKRLTVIDYIGNHRSFLIKVRSLLSIEAGGGDLALQNALLAAQNRSLVLPPGCEVTYDLQVIDILRALLRVPSSRSEALRAYYVDFKERHGQRPTASEAFHDGYDPHTARKGEDGSWLGLVKNQNDFDPQERMAFDACHTFLNGLESMRMSRSYKMLVLLAMLNTDTLPSPEGIGLEALQEEFARLTGRSETLRGDFGPPLHDPGALRTLLRSEPVREWTGEGAIPGVVAFTWEGERLRFSLPVPSGTREAFQRLVRELAEWRLSEYLAPPDLHRLYMREQIPRLFGQPFSEALWNAGFVVISPEAPKHVCLLVTLEKDGMEETFHYENKFLTHSRFQWQSQNRTRQADKHGRLIHDHEAKGVAVHLFVRARKRLHGSAAPFVYCGPLRFESWHGEQPITVNWTLTHPLSDRLMADFSPSAS